MAQVIDFDSRVEVRQGFTGKPADLEAAIFQTASGGSTSLHNAIYIALKELKKVQARSSEEIRRQAIVVLSDGEDTSSLVSFDEVLELAKRSETAIYAIGLRSRGPGRARGSFNESDFVLRQLAQETGGKAFFARAASELSGIYEQISDELSSQYMVGYSSKNPKRDGAWRRIVVRVLESGATARTKQGYYGPTS
jgi:Ca-activated chloride channel family protein